MRHLTQPLLRPCQLAFALFFAFLSFSADATQQAPAPLESGNRSFKLGAQAFENGRFQEAIGHFQNAANFFETAKSPESEARAKGNLAVALQVLGKYKLAQIAVYDALNLLEGGRSAGLEAELQVIRASIGIFSRQPKSSATGAQGFFNIEESLAKNLEWAQKQGDRRLQAIILHNLALFYLRQEDQYAASDSFLQCIDLCKKDKNAPLLAQASVNAALSEIRFAKKSGMFPEEAAKFLALASESIDRNQGVGDRLPVLIKLGEAYGVLSDLEFSERLSGLIEPGSGGYARKAFNAYRKALNLAVQAQEPVFQCFALLGLAELYEKGGNRKEALELARDSLVAARKVGSGISIFRANWQLARLLADSGKKQDKNRALEACLRSLDELKRLRHDLAISYGSFGLSYREQVAKAYFLAADLILQQADGETSEEKVQRACARARDVIEDLKVAELNDYFQDDCINVALAQQKEVSTVDVHSAVFYIIPMERRTELLVALKVSGDSGSAANSGEQIHRFSVAVPGEQIQSWAREFRQYLMDEEDYSYGFPAMELYNALIRPAEDLLSEKGIQNLIFIPDGALATIPMAALYDDEKQEFLIKKYSVSIVPGMALLNPQQTPRENARPLICALEEARQGFPPLLFVEEETSQIQQLYGNSDVLLNDKFNRVPFRNQFQQHDYRIVHIASHGVFGGKSQDSFILTYNDHLSLDDLEALLRPRKFADQPVELLALSACETALGDEQAALGLAGITFKAGARSALATLWKVDDFASKEIIGNFYRYLQESNPRVSKAEALRKAQLKWIDDSGLQLPHPIKWSPYLIIGNWL